jgi:hypothetical protein
MMIHILHHVYNIILSLAPNYLAFVWYFENDSRLDKWVEQK